METRTQKPPRVAARDVLVRALQIAPGRALELIAGLGDSDVAEIVAAAGQAIAAETVQTVLSRANDRRRDAAADEARQRQKTLRRSALARKVLERELGMTIDESMLTVKKLTSQQLDQLAALESTRGCGEECWAVIGLVPAETNDSN